MKVKRVVASIISTACVCGLFGITMLGVPRAFAGTLESPTAVRITATPYEGKAETKEQVAKKEKLKHQVEKEKVVKKPASDVSAKNPKVTKEQALKIAKDYKYDDYVPEDYRHYAIKFVKSTSPASPDKWMIAFGWDELAKIKKYGDELDARHEQVVRGEHPKPVFNSHFKAVSVALYVEVNAVTGKVITCCETYDLNGLTEKDK